MGKFPKYELLLLRGWLKAATVVLPGILAHEARDEPLRSNPRVSIKLPPRQGPQKRKDLKRSLEDILEALRRHGEATLAEDVAGERKLNRQAILLRRFYNEQVALYGDPEDRSNKT